MDSSTHLPPIDFSLDDYFHFHGFVGSPREEAAKTAASVTVAARCSGLFSTAVGRFAQGDGSSRGVAFDASLGGGSAPSIAIHSDLAVSAVSAARSGGEEKRRRLGHADGEDPSAGLAAPPSAPVTIGGSEVPRPPLASPAPSKQAPVQAGDGRAIPPRLDLENVTTIAQVFLYYDVNFPGQENNIKEFIAIALYQYYLKKEACDEARKKLDWGEFHAIVRSVCTLKFPLFSDFLGNMGYLIRCLFRNLPLYVPGNMGDFLAEVQRIEKKYTSNFPIFFKSIVKLFRDDLAILKAAMSTSV